MTADYSFDLEDAIAAARRGDEAAAAAIYHHYVEAVYRLAYGVLLHEQDAEEVVQDSFAYAFRNIHRFDPARSAFRTWLYMIATSRCRNKRRRRWLPTVWIGDWAERLSGGSPQPEAAAAQQSARAAVLDALRQLSPKLREAVVLRYFDGLTFRELAEVLGVPQKTAESRVRLGHDALFRLLEDDRDALLASLLTGEVAW